MRTLSIRQPWAWLVTHRHLRVINGDRTDYRGAVLIRAGMTLTRRLHGQVAEFARGRWGVTLPAFEDLGRGGIVGAAILDDVGAPSPDHWSAPEADYPAGLVLVSAIELPLFACTPTWHPTSSQWYDVPMRSLPLQHQREIAALELDGHDEA